MKRCCLPFSALLLGALFLAQPKPAHAIVVAAQLCATGEFPCAVPLDSGFRVAGPAVMPFNSWVYLPFSFSDASVTFTGAVLVVDVLVGGVNGIYSWGTGVAQDNTGAGVGDYLDIGITQSYATVAANNWAFGEINVGSCNAGGVLNSNVNGVPGPGSASGSAVEGVVNNAGLAVLTASCGGTNPWVLASGPYGPATVGVVTALTTYGQFYFNNGANGGLNQAISLPWGADFPDPTYDSGLFPTVAQLEADNSLTDLTPEPGTATLLCGGIGIAALLLRRRRS
jgi:hypothetical protein